MAHKKKILVITGSRAEYGLLRPVIAEIKLSRTLELRLLVTGMHTLKKYGDTLKEVRRETRVHVVVPIRNNNTMLEALATEIQGIERYCKKYKPDIILVLGDRDEALAGALVGGHNKIAVAHIHGGDTLGFLVDEAIRHSITKFAHIHFPATKKSAGRIAHMGEEKRRIHMVGSTAFDARELRDMKSRAELATKFKLNPHSSWLLVVQHPTPLDTTPIEKQLSPTLRALRDNSSQKIFIYPNSDTGSDQFVFAIEKLRGLKDFTVLKNLPRTYYLSFLKECGAVVGNSSSGIIEAGHFGKPVIDIGGRQRGRECGNNVIHVPYHAVKITRALSTALSASFKRKIAGTHNPYGSGNAAKKIVNALEKLQINDQLFYKRFSSI